MRAPQSVSSQFAASTRPCRQVARRGPRMKRQTNLMRWRGVAGAMLVLWTGAANAAPSARQDDDLTPSARELSDHGLQQYKQGDYDAAIESFAGAFALSSNPGLLFNVAQAYRLKRDCAHARNYYRRYLEAVPETSLKPSVEERLQEMERCLKTNAVSLNGSPASPLVAAAIAEEAAAPIPTPTQPSWQRPAV